MTTELKQQKSENVAPRGFKSHPVRSLDDNELGGECNKNVTPQTQDEAKKAREVMALVRGLAMQKTAWCGWAR